MPVKAQLKTSASGNGFLADALKAYRKAFRAVLFFSFIINILMLVSPIYLLQLYDRVLTSGSTDTLIMLTLIALFLLIVLALLEGTRRQTSVRVATSLDEDLHSPVFEAQLQALARQQPNAFQGVRDLEQLRQFLAGGMLMAFFDAPWSPFFLALIFIMHPLLGFIALAGVIIIFLLALATDWLSRRLLDEGTAHQIRANRFLETTLRNQDVLRTMGLDQALQKRWAKLRKPGVFFQTVSSDRLGVLQGATKSVRFTLQIVMLGTAGWLTLRQEITPGFIIAASIIMSRALAPVEQAIGGWRGYVSARGAWRRLNELLALLPEPTKAMPLPRPAAHLAVNKLVAGFPHHPEPLLKGIDFEVQSGQLLVILGQSGVGKTFLTRFLLGLYLASRGTVKLGGINIFYWQESERGRYIGYLPQDVELFDGTIAENIARFGQLDAGSIIAATEMACCHDMILSFPKGYETPVGAGGMFLSGGQRQRIALARAIYGDPVMVVLDEPDSNLDVEGTKALVECLERLKIEGKVVIVVTHNRDILRIGDSNLLIRDGIGHLGVQPTVVRSQDAAGKNLGRMKPGVPL